MSFEVGVQLDFRSPQWVMKPVETPLRCWGPGGLAGGNTTSLCIRADWAGLRPSFVTADHLHAPNPTEATTDEFV